MKTHPDGFLAELVTERFGVTPWVEAHRSPRPLPPTTKPIRRIDDPAACLRRRRELCEALNDTTTTRGRPAA